jgi:nucleotide-binding universal stress UspA family protein
MALYTRIIVPLDGSKLAERALPEAEQLAKLTGAPLLLLRVVDYSSRDRLGDFGLLYEYEAMAQALAEEHEIAEAYLADVVRKLEAEDYTVSATVVDGIAAKAIVALAQPGDAIVMATHGRTGVDHFILGSIAEKVVAHAPCPVLVVPRRGREAATAKAA